MSSIDPARGSSPRSEYSTSAAASEPVMARWKRLAWRLVALTLAYNVVEGVVALWSGQVAGSIALLGFGFDSAIETSASALVLWRLGVEARGGSAQRVAAAERTVCRVVGVTFLLLAVYISVQSVWQLIGNAPPQPSPVGIALAAASVVVMPILTVAKLRVADRVGSAALRAEAKGTLACSLLSIPLLVGLVANATFAAWWADPVAALIMLPWLLVEARQALRGQSCCSPAVDACTSPPE